MLSAAVCVKWNMLSYLISNQCHTRSLLPHHYLQRFLIILHAAAGSRGQRFLQVDVIHLLGTVLGLLGYGRWQAVSVRIEHVAWQGGMGADGWAAASVDSAGEERGGTCGRASGGQLRLTAGAVIEAGQYRTVAVAPADHRALPIKGEVPPRPRLFDLSLDLRIKNEAFYFVSAFKGFSMQDALPSSKTQKNEYKKGLINNKHNFRLISKICICCFCSQCYLVAQVLPMPRNPVD